LADPLEGVGWANVNSTFMGGGVAEMLQSVIPLARSLGIRASWYVIRGHDAFFNVTKKFHNMLQGVDNSITLEEIFGAYLDTIDENSRNTYIASDMVVVHDPQPAALVMNGVIFGNVLWRCHIDTSEPNMTIWRFLLPYINHCAGAIFTMPEFVGPGLQIPTYQITPCIDPLAQKNHQYTTEESLEILDALFNEHNIDPVRPIVAAVSRYDIHKNQATILEAFRKLCKENSFDKPPYLIFLGNTATDDPEGEAMLNTLKESAGDMADVRFWVNVEDNDRIVGALMQLARCFVHVSTREGFGLVVSEALWQGTPVIGSTTGGIVRQVVDGKTGYLVAPMDVDRIAGRIIHLLKNPDQAEVLGEQAREHVRQNFLLPELMRRYLTLLHFYTGTRRELPEFRLNGLSYSEVISVLRSRHPDLESRSMPLRRFRNV
ncbi:MAG: glycosyltransferase, partial [Planctomycetota bacterium]